ncbi:MAG: hypothetical protein ACOY90_06065 [Candidatus Zhuqueibacterota bacterium]
METKISTGLKVFDNLLPTIKNFLAKDQVTYTIDGERVHGYRSPDCNAIWIRDHSDILRGARYFERDMLSGAAHFASTQLANGSLMDFVSCAMDRENWTKYVRVPVEADVEYRFVKALYLGWQATGDSAWVEKMLPHAERALGYTMNHPWRWASDYGLVKRAFTIDTWDFDYVGPNQPWLNFQISEQTHWGIFHGDNSGLYEACSLLARLYNFLGNDAKAQLWADIASGIRERANRLCWNGQFYTHRIPLDGFTVPNFDESAQLSLSNPMAINRGLATHEMAVNIIQEYQRRSDRAFAEWFSIDPPFPAGMFGDPKIIAGAYINGGIFPLVGGELARAAFEHGFEKYAAETLIKYGKMIEQSGETFLWYFPDGRPSSVETSTSPEATPTDGWGSSAMLYAFIEGLAGVVDQSCLFREVRLSPRWVAAGLTRATVQVGYGAGDSGIGYEFEWRPAEKRIDVKLAGKSRVRFHLLLPAGSRAATLKISGRPADFVVSTVGESHYSDFALELAGQAEVELHLK